VIIPVCPCKAEEIVCLALPACGFLSFFPERKTEEEKRQIYGNRKDHRESAERRQPGDPYEEAPDPLCAGIRLEGPDGDLGGFQSLRICAV